MTVSHPPDFDAFRALSARLGKDPLRVQGPGGNTSLKDGPVMWIKASGTELADAEVRSVFVPVDHPRALAEARGESGDGSCKGTVVDPEIGLRPSIETTFHAALDWPIVVHTHSIATLVHAAGPAGRAAAREKLAGLPAVFVPYAKPGLPLTGEIVARARPDTQVFVLENHGLIVTGQTTTEVAAVIEDVEQCLAMPPRALAPVSQSAPPPDGFDWAEESWIAKDAWATQLAVGGSYYPDHVVFLGPALPVAHTGDAPAVLHEGLGIAIRNGATPSQRAMLRCLSDFLLHLPEDWVPEPIGPAAEADLMNWDAEKYRQALAARQ